MMAKYKILIKKSAAKEIKSLPKKELSKVLKKISALTSNPRPDDCKKLYGQNQYRIRQGYYRIVYTIEDDVLTIQVVKVGHRREVYRNG